MTTILNRSFDDLENFNLVEEKSLFINKYALIELLNQAKLIDERIPDWCDFREDDRNYGECLEVMWKQNLTDEKRQELGHGVEGVLVD